jgi:hypothetical protein
MGRMVECGLEPNPSGVKFVTHRDAMCPSVHCVSLTGVLQVPGCSFCTKSLCFEHIKEPIGSCDEVSATCVDYDTYWRLTVILLILFLLFSLLIIGCLRDVPVVSLCG